MTIVPCLNASCAPTSSATIAHDTPIGIANSIRRRIASERHERAERHDEQHVDPPGRAAQREARRARSVIALAWTSGPAIAGCCVVDVEWRSWSDGAVAPTTTTLPRTSAGSNFPSRTSTKLR